MVNLIILLECFAICLIFVALILLLNGEGAREQKLLIFIMCSSLVQNVGYLPEITAPTVEAAMAAIKVENVGSAFAPLCYCRFIYIYCSVSPPKTLLRTLAAISFFVLPTVFFNWNGLFYREVAGKRFSICQHILRSAVRSLFGTPMTMAIAMSMVVIVVWSRRNYDFRHLAAEKALESPGDGVIALDDHDRPVSYNQAAAHFFTTLSHHKLGENIRVVEDFQEEMLNENIPRSFSINGQHYECHSKQIIDENGKKQGCVILILDMTDIKAYINEIKRVRRQAEKANVAKSEFLANMSHEIRTPMNAIIGLNDIIIEESKDPQIYAHAKDVQSAARNLLAIINDILDLSKVEAGKMELVCTDYHLKTVIDEVVGMMDMAASQGNTEFIAKNFPRLLESYETLLLQIGLFLDSRNQHDSQDKLPPLTAPTAITRLKHSTEELRRMDAIINKETLEQILDQALQDVTEQTAGVRLHQGDKPPGENLCTVHITFDKGFDTGLTLYADTNLLVRMAQNSFHEETVTQEDLEEFSKEYFNVLCGKIAGALYRETRVAAHFSQPTFYHGRYIPG